MAVKWKLKAVEMVVKTIEANQKHVYIVPKHEAAMNIASEFDQWLCSLCYPALAFLGYLLHNGWDSDLALQTINYQLIHGFNPTCSEF